MPGNEPLIEETDFTGTTTKHLRSEPTSELKFTFTGDLATGSTLTLAELANSIVLRRGGEPFINESAEYFHERNLLLRGQIPTIDGSDGADEEIVWYVPFYQPEWPQALEVQPDNLKLTVNWDSISDKTFDTAAKVEIEQMTSPQLEERYLPIILPDDLSVSASSSGLPKEFPEANITRLWFREADGAVISSLEIIQGTRTRVSNVDLDDLRHNAMRFNDWPDGTTKPTFAEWPAVDGLANQGTVLSRETSIRISSTAAGTLEITRERLGNSEFGQLSRDRIQRELQSA